MAVKIFYTKVGQIIGDVTQTNDRSVKMESPVFLQFHQQGITMTPILVGTEESAILLQLDDTMFGTLEGFTPVAELRNEYSTRFGSGIQLLA